jgi:uncharacterized membrane protein YGL010W
LLEDPVQAFILAPLFVFLQYLFMFGLFPGTKKRLIEKTAKAILKYRKSLKKLAKVSERDLE